MIRTGDRVSFTRVLGLSRFPGLLLLIIALYPAGFNFAQSVKLSFADLANLQRLDFADINDRLVKLGWRLHKISNPEKTNYGDATWVYAADTSISEIAFFKYYYAPGRYPRTAFIFQNPKVYQNFLNGIKKNKMQKLESRAEDNMIVTDFAGKDNVVSVSVYADAENSTTYYTFLMFDRKDFDRIKKH